MTSIVVPRVEPRTTRGRLFTRGAQMVPALIAFALLVAAFLKGFEVATEELSETDLLSSRWLLTSLVLFELALACWLLGGLNPRETRWLLLVTFAGFFEVALFLAMAGYGSCHCLGRTTLSPWAAVAFDAGAIAAIVLWQPAISAPSVISHPRRLALIGLVFALASIPALASMVNYTPTGRMPRLREDPALAAKINLQFKAANAEQVLERLQAGTGLAFSLEPSVDNRPRGFREFKTSGTPAWAIMELLAHHQTTPVRWEKFEGGYQLVPSARLGIRTPWLISGAALLVAGAYLLCSQPRSASALEPCESRVVRS